MSKVDLHLHSTASDGRLSPEDIVSHSAKLGLTVIAIADHDTIDGIVPAQVAARAFPGLRVIPAVEINTDVPNGEAHVLGYFIDYANPELEARLSRLRASRRERAQKMIDKLANLGIYIDWGRVQEIAGSGTIARPHLALALLEKAYISSVPEAFAKYIGRDCPAYVEREKITPTDAVALVLNANGLPVLAHPFTVKDPKALIVELKSAGLVGIEAYYAGYTNDEVDKLVGLADRDGLIATGGSDFHGLDTTTDTLIGSAEVPMEAAERLIALAQQRGLTL